MDFHILNHSCIPGMKPTFSDWMIILMCSWIRLVSKPKQQQIIYGLDLLGKFFQVLSNVTLPVLFSLWEVVVHELNQKDHDFLNMETYKSYLTDNYGAIAYDFLSIPDDIILKWGSLDFMGKNRINNTLLLKYGKENPAHYKEITLNGKPKKYIFPRKSSR